MVKHAQTIRRLLLTNYFSVFDHFVGLAFKGLILFQPNVAFHIETSHLICSANQITGFYMKCNTGLKGV